jgi:hypothetical protein
LRGRMIVDQGLNSERDHLSLYGFSVDYPRSARLELKPKSTRQQGEVAIHLDNQMKLLISWGDLSNTGYKYINAEAQARDSLERARKMREVRDLQITEHSVLTLRGHDAVYNRARFGVATHGILKDRKLGEQETNSLHLHCPQSHRYYVFYGSATSVEESRTEAEILREIAQTLQCH